MGECWAATFGEDGAASCGTTGGGARPLRQLWDETTVILATGSRENGLCVVDSIHDAISRFVDDGLISNDAATIG